MRNQSHKQSGFTLLELIIVIVSIVILTYVILFFNK
jgi:prepilin-type N-terminal cleavage/methylation domain-containing protein